MVKCPICEHPRNLECTNAVLKGELRISELMEIMSIDDRRIVEVHLKEHIRVLSSDEGVVAVEFKEIDSIGVLTKLTTRLDAIAEELLDTVHSSKNVLDTTNLRLANDTIKEIRGCLRTIGEFKGDIQTGLKVELQLQTNFMTKLQNFLMEELCEADKRKLLNWLEQHAE